MKFRWFGDGLGPGPILLMVAYSAAVTYILFAYVLFCTQASTQQQEKTTKQKTKQTNHKVSKTFVRPHGSLGCSSLMLGPCYLSWFTVGVCSVINLIYCAGALVPPTQEKKEKKSLHWRAHVFAETVICRWILMFTTICAPFGLSTAMG